MIPLEYCVYLLLLPRLEKRRARSRTEKQRVACRKWRLENPDKHRQAVKTWNKANPVRVRENHKRWCDDNRVRKNELAANWRAENPEKIKKINREQYLNKQEIRKEATRSYRKNNPGKIREANNRPNRKIASRMRRRILDALKNNWKSDSTLKLLGCSIEFLRAHLEKQFVPGMTWENYGPVWHVDHILPCAEFHLQHSEEQEVCFHWTNLQPLFAKENMQKGASVSNF